jgi:hypothetical protein
MDDPSDTPSDHATDKRGKARRLAEKALREEAAGNDEAAEGLFAEANRTDPDAVEAVLREAVVSRPRHVPPPTDDRELARSSRQVRGGADAPSRSGISKTGSGADSERR